MSIKVEDCFVPETFQRIKALADRQETPFVIIDKRAIADAYDQLTDCFPFARVYYTVEVDPATEITELLRDEGSDFGIASIHEPDKIMKTGVGPECISCDSTIEGPRDIRYSYRKGVRLLTTDSEADLRNIAKVAPGAKTYARILTESSAITGWPLSRGFGCQTDMATDLPILARQLGLEPYDISFHVDLRQCDISVWGAAIAKIEVIFERLKEGDDTALKVISMGGGFPANYITKTNDLKTYAEETVHFLEEDFGDDLPGIILRPDRSLIVDAGILVSGTVLVAHKSRITVERWVYADVDRFSGLIEAMDESIRFPIQTEKQDGMEEVMTTDPTCGSADITYEHYKYGLPLNLANSNHLY